MRRPIAAFVPVVLSCAFTCALAVAQAPGALAAAPSTEPVDAAAVDVTPLDVGPMCRAPQVECAGVCVDTSRDDAHCGACGTACVEGELCLEGTCARGCPAGFTDCDGTCIDTGADAAHCGACTTACAAEPVIASASVSIGPARPTSTVPACPATAPIPRGVPCATSAGSS